ncbi:hypothetical protein LGR54_07140 [Ancylobacter sp. Lp-2]|uniref:hypothetical protein n=1 Tax=Ancylobacter sp. Lp-2 TaxID=2881339 RepID=UPI001E3902F4|nr:hypothetical protein [Ancylobacter sp. Lp-2]MCB4768374.1 hypothetical protein [Ancylobacter sp. Lp-2]
MVLCKLTQNNGSPVWINPEHVVRVYAGTTGTTIALNGGAEKELRSSVQEDPETVVTMLTTPAKRRK